ACLLALSPTISWSLHFTGVRLAPLIAGSVLVLLSLAIPFRRHAALLRQQPALFVHALFFVLVAAVAVKFIEFRAVVSSRSNHTDWWGGTIVSNFSTSASLIPRYLELTLWPDRLIGDYFQHTLTVYQTPLALGPLLGVGLVLTMIGVGTLFWRRG
ncbi:MAG: hypothetical protein KC561_00250, partial [Myxococcales bacterium]|nr:hypothetical protein [Myxococcales bacterium]